MPSKYNRLTTQQWEIMKKYLPEKTKGHYSLRDIVDTIFWILRTGSQWRNLPQHYPKWQSVYYDFKKWEKDGTLVRLNASLDQLERKRVGKAATPSMLYHLYFEFSQKKNDGFCGLETVAGNFPIFTQQPRKPTF